MGWAGITRLILMILVVEVGFLIVSLSDVVRLMVDGIMMMMVGVVS